MQVRHILLAMLAGAAGLGFVAWPHAATAQQWTLATQDTRLTIALDAQNLPSAVILENPTQRFNWLQRPSQLPLLSSATCNGQTVATNWQFQGATVDNSLGSKVTLRYASAATGLQMTSEWWARPGAGPIHQSSYITNASASPVGIAYQPTLGLQLTTPGAGAAQMWHFATDGAWPDGTGVYRQPIDGSLNSTVHTAPAPSGTYIPLAVLDSGGRQGLYVGTEWSYGDIKVVGSSSNPGNVTVQSGNVQDFSTTLTPGQVFEVPPGFIGTYNGDIDAAGNSLRKYLFNYSMPAVLRNDSTYPKVQWDAFGPTGKSPGSWDPVQSKYYPLIDDIAPLGYDEVMIDVGWWQGAEPDTDLSDWAWGMKAAADYAHQRGMRFGLYWYDDVDMTTAAGRQTRANRIKRLFQEHGADIWKSDAVPGTYDKVIANNYWSVKGFYDMVDGLQQQLPNFQWLDCNGGGTIKDYGAYKRCTRATLTDAYSELDARKAFYDTSFAFHPMQIDPPLGSSNGSFNPAGQGVVALRYAFRSSSMGAPEWFIDAPNGGNGGTPWTAEQKAAITECVATWKAKIRPLVRNADLYHIFPRPDGTVWDGLEYYDPDTAKGVVFIFKPDSPNNTQTILLKGLNSDWMYHLTFEDGSNPAVSMLGADLMNAGIDVTLYGTRVSELMFFEAPEPGTFVLLFVGLVALLAYVWQKRK